MYSVCAVCANCAFQVWETSVRAGGGSATQALVAAGATSVGARRIGTWLAARGCGWVTRARVTFATTLLVTIAIVVVVLSTADRVLY